MGQIEDLVERFKAQDALFKDFEIDNIVKAIIEHTNNCDSLPTGDKIKALSFLYNKCDYILNSIASSMNYELEYEPSDDEIWRFVEQEKKHIDPNCDDLSYYDNFIADDSGYLDESGLYEIVIEPMRKKYKEKYKEASEWCDKIYDLQTGIYTKISREKSKKSFFEEALKEDTKIIKTTIDDCLVNCNKEIIKRKLVPLLRGRKGEGVAVVIEALTRLSYTTENVQTLHNIFENEFNIIGSYSGVTHWTKSMRDKTKQEDPGVIDALFKMDAVMKELQQ